MARRQAKGDLKTIHQLEHQINFLHLPETVHMKSIKSFINNYR
eukprot:UN15671